MGSNPAIIPLIPPGKVRCYVSGQLRKDTPEENVRQRWARSLVDEYGYDLADLGVEAPISMGRARKFADIVVYAPGSEHKQENITIVVEAKREDLKAGDKKKGDGQLISYMAACPRCKYGLWVGEDRRSYAKNAEGATELVPDIPRAGDDTPRKPVRTDLKPVHEMTSIFRRCHNYIHANGGFQKAEAFHEMLKLIFCKAYDEEEGEDELEFCVAPTEQRSASGRRRLLDDRIAPMFEEVKELYPYIFEASEVIKLEPAVLAYVVSELQFVSLLTSSTDVKGEAYETLVGANLRGDRGEYFTPRNVCDMTVQIIMSLHDEKNLAKLKVVDCCCGTGGFLVSWLDNLRDVLLEQGARRRTRGIGSKVRERLRTICERNLFGVDINPQLVRTSQMNMVMHGDGSTNVFKANSLQTPGEWSEEARQRVPYGKFDVVITNPPFGSEVRIDDNHILDRYEIASWDATNRRAAMPAEQLFVETAMNFLKPGGVMGLILPDGILNNPGLGFLRSWLVRRGQLVASVALPKETFGRNKGVNNPSVLIVRKFTAAERKDAERGIFDLEHEVFMAAPATSGIDKRGNSVFLRHPDGQHIMDAEGHRVPDDEISLVAGEFKEWIGG